MIKSEKTGKTIQNNRSISLVFILVVLVLLLILVSFFLLGMKWEMIWNWITKHTNFTLIITLAATVLGGLIVRWVIRFFTYLRFYSRPYITFEADFTQVFHLDMKVDNLEYSVGEKRWEIVGTQNIVFGGNRGKLLLRGCCDWGTYGANISFATNAQVICTGDIRTLIDYKHYNEADTSKAVFKYLFLGCTQLVVAPELTPKVLAERCYAEMFCGCKSLKIAPELPAEKLAIYCYYEMFADCTSLKKAPKLPAKKLADCCYLSMFYGCTSLEEAPKLPVEKLAVECYRNMFRDCSSLLKAPELPAEKVVYGCYWHMFENCTSLKHAPILPAECLTDYCYCRMFSNCTSLDRVKMLATKVCFNHIGGWLENTSLTGIFYKNKNASWDNNGIVPLGWEIELVDS